MRQALLAALCCGAAAGEAAQGPPRLVSFEGIALDEAGGPRTGVVALTFALYDEPNGGTPLWFETQAVELDAQGGYRVQLGATTAGLPADMFASGAARWLGVRVEPGPEQPRTRLLAVPYAVAAADAATLGGKTADALVQADGLREAVRHELRIQGGGNETIAATVNQIPKFTSSGGALDDSAITDASGKIGIGTASPSYLLQLHSAGGHSLMQMTTASTGANAADGSYVGVLAGDPTLRIMNQEAGGIYLATGFPLNSGGVTLSSAGRLGFGTSSPTSLLHVHGAAPDDFPATLGLFNSTTGTASNAGARISMGRAPNLPLKITNFENAAIEFHVNQARRLTIEWDGTIRFHMGTGNIGIGEGALDSVTTGTFNTAIGKDALTASTTGSSNTAIGVSALAGSTAESYNTGVHGSAYGGDENTVVKGSTDSRQSTVLGYQAIGTGVNNIALGRFAGDSSNHGNTDNIYIRSSGTAGESGRIRIGTAAQAFISGIRGVTTGLSDAVEVVVDSGNQLGTVSSSRRYKQEIQDLGPRSLGVLRLRPVTFRYRQPFAAGATLPQYGLIAEEVADVYPDLVVFDDTGTPLTVQYQKLDVLLLGELQRQQRDAEARQRSLEERRRQLAWHRAQVEAQRRQIAFLQQRIDALAQSVR